MISHKAVRRVNFTGSTRVGRVIARTCAMYLKPCVLELGGKAPLIVLEDADLDAAANAVVFGGFGNMGQICMSTERIIVVNEIADVFVPLLVKRVEQFVSDDAVQEPRVLGPVADASAIVRGNALIKDALAKGAKLLCGGVAESALMTPTLLDGVTSEMDIFEEETFGPIKAIIRVDNAEQAIRTANASDFGLSAALFSRDTARAWQLAQKIESGICHVNGPTVHDEPQMPFGGMKDSGYGRFGGDAGVEAFTELRWLSMQTVPRTLPF
tara:strand:+ start:63958 stop:64764 length:807 start_codon:yes stop_codon:yes gene_type:complete